MRSFDRLRMTALQQDRVLQQDSDVRSGLSYDSGASHDVDQPLGLCDKVIDSPGDDRVIHDGV